MNKFFSAKTIAVVGVSHNPQKVGHVIFHNLLEGGYKGKVYPVHPTLKEVAGKKCYSSVSKIPGSIDLVIIAVPNTLVPKVITDCAKKKINHVVIISAGFKEIGNMTLDKKLMQLLDKHKIKAIGPNCLGVFDAHTAVDSLFLPRYRLSRPRPGGISFICQSGAVGSAILDLASKRHFGFSKFVSYGNASTVDESDLLLYLDKDKSTKVICMYIESVKDGKKFLQTVKKVKKPIIAIKGGMTAAGAEAAMSHTGSLAGEAAVYKGVFSQHNIVHAQTVEQLFDFAKMFEEFIKAKGKRIQIITNGGGFGILAADAVANSSLEMATPSQKTIAVLKKTMPELVVLKNPIDLIGDATTKRYNDAMRACLQDNNIDLLLVIALYQTPRLDTELLNIIAELHSLKKKPMAVVSCGGGFTEVLSEALEAEGVPVFTFPENAVKALEVLAKYSS